MVKGVSRTRCPGQIACAVVKDLPAALKGVALFAILKNINTIFGRIQWEYKCVGSLLVGIEVRVLRQTSLILQTLESTVEWGNLGDELSPPIVRSLERYDTNIVPDREYDIKAP